MFSYLDTLKVIVVIAFRNLFASWLKTLIVGGIILFGSTLVVVGTAMVDSVNASMSKSIIGSVAGHIQVYNAKSKDELAVMGGFQMDAADLEQIDDFKKMRETLLSVPNVKAVVPMGLSGAMVPAGNTVDVMLEKLRDLVRRQQGGEDVQAAINSQKDHVKQIVDVLATDMANVGKILTDKAVMPEEKAALDRASAPGFWAEFDKDPLGTLEFLENRIAPIATDADMLFLRYVGTDLGAFANSFDRMKIIDGTTVPPGQRGFLFAKWTYEEQVKLKTAHRLDLIHDGILKRGKKIATDLDLQRMVKQNATEVKEITLQLDSQQKNAFRSKLQKELGSQENDVASLLASFFRVDDGNVLQRYKFFYDELAPSLTLYRVRVGDTLTIKSFTKNGYVQSVNLKVYGTFAFEGLEDSQLAGSLNLMDMVSFRDLYGFSTPEREKEISALKANAGAKEIDRDKIEAELFGGGEADDAATEATVGSAVKDAEEVLRGLAGKSKRRMEDQSYDPAQLEQGVIVNAAVIVKDPSRIPQTMRDIEAAGSKAGFTLKAIDWQKASGLIGQFVTMIRAVLYVSVLIIFAVALVIINNALVMATLERMAEIGTLRAVGAQRRFLLGMLVVETLAVGALFGGIGSLLGIGIIMLMRMSGIPATNDTLYFLFSGPRLYPGLSPTNIAIALFIVMVVSTLSSIYPGLLAMRVSPRQAMQSDE
jgi:ABC-type lipoprotein release transport system permease subunit